MSTESSFHSPQAVGTASFAAAAAALILLRPELQLHRQLSSIIACLVAVACLTVIVRARPSRPISLGSVYFALLALFHIGLLVPIAVGLPVVLFNGPDSAWVESESFVSASVLTSIGMLAFTVGYRVRSTRQPRGIPDQRPLLERDRASGLDGAGIVGTIMVLGGIAVWLQIALTSGVALVGTSYGGFLQATGSSSIATAYLLIGFGLGVVATSAHSASRRLSLVSFGAWSLVAFAIGLRGEVIIPIAAYLVVRARTRSIPLRAWMVAAPVVALSLGSAVRVIRQSGLGGAPIDINAFSPLQGIAELGYTIRPLTVVTSLHDLAGEAHTGVATYLAPFRRFLEGRLLGLDVLSVDSDPAVFGGFIANRVGPIGGSPIAEAYRSGGTAGVLLIMVAIGLLVAYLDAVPSRPYPNAAVGMIGFSLLLWVRNDFTPVPAQFFLATFVVIAIAVFDRPQAKALTHRSRRRSLGD